MKTIPGCVTHRPFGSFSATYGSIGGVLVFLIWLWLTNIAILLGAEITAEIERTRAIEAGEQPVRRSCHCATRRWGRG